MTEENSDRSVSRRKFLGVGSAAIGARVTVKAGDLVQFSEVRGGASYLSQNDLRLHFGLGANHTMTEVSIRWPNGETETLHDVPADFIYTVVEGEGIRQKTALPPVSPAGSQAWTGGVTKK